eukprot:10299001-Alexandrium_andersonii.AAC.1
MERKPGQAKIVHELFYYATSTCPDDAVPYKYVEDFIGYFLERSERLGSRFQAFPCRSLWRSIGPLR